MLWQVGRQFNERSYKIILNDYIDHRSAESFLPQSAYLKLKEISIPELSILLQTFL